MILQLTFNVNSYEDLQKLKKLQGILEQITVKGSSGGGEVRVELSGIGVIKKVNIEDLLFRSCEKVAVENMIVAACADAHARLRDEWMKLGYGALGEG